MMKDTDFKIMVMSAINKLLAQGEQSREEYNGGCNGGCMYRNNKGLCCVVGFMMDDETARKADAEGEPSITGVVSAGIWGEDLSDAQVNQLYKLQGCHDFVDPSKPFNEEFIRGVNAERDLLWVAEYIGARE